MIADDPTHRPANNQRPKASLANTKIAGLIRNQVFDGPRHRNFRKSGGAVSSQGEVVEHKRLGSVIEHIKDLQEQRIEERIKRKDTTKRDARLLRAGILRHTVSPPSKAPPR